jgi:sterol desaturase/sphingolipid hydroxylase (fatty acid hydroxylase superfamily)
MFNKFEDFETLFTILLGLTFHFFENIRPARANKRKQNLTYDLIAFFVLVVSVNISRLALNQLYTRLLLHEYLAFLSPIWQLPSWIKILAALIAIDFCIYWLHRWMHVNRTLWNTHEWHHSPSHLYWFSGYRTSFLHAFLFAIPQVAIAFFILKLNFIELVWVAVIGVFFQVWTHANINVRLGYIEKLIITPQFHRLHHSKSRLMKTNYGVFFPWWDMLFGSYESPEKHPLEYPLGVNTVRPLWKSLLGL